MKKFLVVLAVAGFAVACNNSSESKDNLADSAKAKVDSTVNATKDAMNTMGDSAKAMIDSTAAAVKDTMKSKM